MSWKSHKGFSLIELVVVIVLAGILSAFVIPRLNINSFEQSGFFIQALAATRHAQKTAMASGCIVIVNIDGTGCTLDWSGGPAGASCPVFTLTPDIINVATGDTDFCASASPEAAPLGGSFRFDPIGRPLDNTDTILLADRDVIIGARTFRVEAETGYPHEL